MDIKQLLRTYTHVNDPKWQTITVKFAIFVMAALAVTAVVVALATLQGPGSDPGAGTAADTATDAGEAGTWECFDRAGYLAWNEQHPDVDVLEVLQLDSGRLCVYYVP